MVPWDRVEIVRETIFEVQSRSRFAEADTRQSRKGLGRDSEGKMSSLSGTASALHGLDDKLDPERLWERLHQSRRLTRRGEGLKLYASRRKDRIFRK